MIRMVNLMCPKCGMSLDCDASHMQSHCPNCGTKLFISVLQVMDILNEKKEAKRKGIVYVNNATVMKQKTAVIPKKKNKDMVAFIVILSVLLMLTVLLRLRLAY